MRLSKVSFAVWHERCFRLSLFCVAAFCVHCGEATTDVFVRPDSLPPHPSHKVASYALVCPPGTQAQGEVPPKSLEQACVKTAADGAKVFHGPYRSWYSSQIKESEGEYRDGKRQGVWYFWHPNAMPESKGFYDHGKRQGEWVFYVAEEDAYRHFFVTYRDDVEHGPWRRLHLAAPGVEPRFTAEEGHVESGKRHGIWKTYYPSGHAYAEGEYALGELQGPAKYWYESGNPWEEGSHQHDLREGEWKEWDDHASGYRKGVYVAGKKEGAWREYDANERVVKIVTYEKGVVVATETPSLASAPSASIATEKSAAAVAPVKP